MNDAEQKQWKLDVLDHIFRALATSKKLEQTLLFKGARVLHVLLGGGRQSLDLDSNLVQTFVEQHPDKQQQTAILEEVITRTLRNYFDTQVPVRYELTAVKIKNHPPLGHPYEF